MINSAIQFHLLNEFNSSFITPDSWNKLLSQGSSDVVFLTWHWQKVWWDVFGRGKLILIIAEEHERPVAIAPLFSDQGMVYFIGSGGSDYLDFIGDISNLEILEGMLLRAVASVPDFLGFCLYHVLETSRLSNALIDIAQRQSWKLYEEGEMASPVLQLKDFPEQAKQSTHKKSLLRHEAYFRRNGGITAEHFNRGEDILPQLDTFFTQHADRWSPTPFPSLFNSPTQCLFYKRLSAIASETDWFRFTRVSWQNRPISFHFGFNYKGSYLWYKPSFDISLSRHSPGEVLLRQLLLQAQKEEAHTFDFGLGDEPFKKRFATDTRRVKTWGLYPQQESKKE